MEKIKNLINPGKSKDDEVMYGSGQSGDPVHTGTGSEATRSDPIASSTHPTGNTSRDPVGQGGTSSTQQGQNPLSSSTMPGAFEDDVESTSSVKSGLPGNSRDFKMTGVPDTRDPLDTNKALPREPATGDTRGFGTTSEAGAGPHSSTLANRADPRIDSNLNDSRGLGSQGTTGGMTASNLPDRTIGNTGNTTDSGRSFPLGGTTTSNTSQSQPRGYGEESWTHDHGKHGHEYSGDPCENEPPAPGALHFTDGPHSLDTANRLDPHVSGGGIGGTTGSTAGSSATNIGHHHPERDAALGAGAGATGAGVYETSRNLPDTTTTRDTSTAGPHSSNLMNKLDPRVDSDLSKQQGSTTGPDTTAPGNQSTTEPSINREHHYGRDATLAGAGGAAGAAAYEGGKHHGHNVADETTRSGYSNPYPPSSTGTGLSSGPTTSSIGAPSTTDPYSSTAGTTTATGPTSTGKDHHYGRDAGMVGAGAGVAYEADKHFGGSHGDITGTRNMDPTRSQQPLSGTSGTGYERDIGVPGGTGTAGFHDSRHQPSSTAGSAGQPSTTYDDRTRAGESHHGRDAALGAGAGAATVAGGEELSRKEMEHQQKAAYEKELKDRETAHKQELKEQKHHQHEQEKAEKAHDKALAKEEKHHQHEKEKAEKAHEKALAKEEAKHQHDEEPQEGEKKHRGILGFLHRDKPDKELKEDEIARKERLEQESHPGAGIATGAGAATAGTAGLSEMEKHQRAKEHDRNRLHKDPPPGFGETEYAEPPKSGYASQVTGGTGTTALAQGEPVSSGSHVTGFGNKTDPAVADRGETVDSQRTRDEQGRVVEPQTGLPIDTMKGSGAGGTDSTPVPGYNAGHSGTQGMATADSAGEGQGFGHFQDHSR